MLDLKSRRYIVIVELSTEEKEYLDNMEIKWEINGTKTFRKIISDYLSDPSIPTKIKAIYNKPALQFNIDLSDKLKLDNLMRTYRCTRSDLIHMAIDQAKKIEQGGG